MTTYLQKNTLFPPQIAVLPSENLGIVVVIPCYNEPDLLTTLNSLKKCNLPNCAVEVIVVINASEKTTQAIQQQNEQTFQAAKQWINQYSTPNFSFYVLMHPHLKAKFAGVGLARKIGMDEAVYRLEKVGNSRGIIVCFDADSQCEVNYLQAIEQHFEAHPQTPASSIYFEHPIEGNNYDAKVYEGIIQYELFLRYYVHALRYAGFPYAHQTIGSSMAVRCDAYQKQGGMNKRKAGEDFYFLQKMMQLGHFTELNTTTVIPSPRPSDRVPFGTGKAINDLLEQQQLQYEAYDPQAFIDLKIFIEQIPDLFFLKKETEQDEYLKKLPKSIQKFLIQQHFKEKLAEIQQHTKAQQNFQKRFFQWFNAFKVLKYVHFTRDNFYANVSTEEAAKWLLIKHFPEVNISNNATLSAKELLLIYREVDMAISCNAS